MQLLRRDFFDSLSLSGVSFALAGITTLLGVMIAEGLYPGAYSTHANTLSDLGRLHVDSNFLPAAYVYNSTLVLTGIWTMLGAIQLFRLKYDILWNRSLLFAYGVGVVCLGFVPSDVSVIHPFLAITTFLIGSLSLLSHVFTERGAFRILSLLLGCISIFSLIGFFTLSPILGAGGIERLVTYPVTLWVVLYGGFLLGKNQIAKK